MLETLRKLIYPPKCILCRRLLEETEVYFCTDCEQKFQSERETLAQLVQRRHEESSGITGLVPQEIYALFPYSNEYRRAILRWKYAGIRKYAEGFASLYTDELHLFEWLQIDALIPVPLAPSRKRKRGFNQSFDLAQEISKRTGIPTLDCLVRTKNTKPQSGCSREERRSNIKGSMRCNMSEIAKEQKLSNIALIDDIYTTGSTIKECCRVLEQEANLKNMNVYVLVVGKGDY